jgi:hypothetical protein
LSRLGAIVLRLFVMVVGYGCAALAASLFLHIVAWPAIAGDMGEPPWSLMGGIFFSVPLMGIFIAGFAFFPALVVLAIAEYFRLRDWLSYAIAGGVAALGAYGILWQGAATFQDVDMAVSGDGQLPLAAEPAALAWGVAAGIAGGLVYWLVAGRSAGRWRE